VPAAAPAATVAPAPLLSPAAPSRRKTVQEIWFVMVAFLALPLTSAVAIFARHLQGETGISRFPTIVSGHPLENMILGILTYAPVVAMVPLALLLLARTGQPAQSLGLGRPRFMDDVAPGLGLAALAFVSEFVLLVPLGPLLAHNSSLVNPVRVGPVPSYYLVWGLSASAMTAVAEETFLNGYLITRLDQLGWSPNRALALSLTLRTSYHVYYGVGFLLTVPFGFFVTRSFQKHRRLNRVIAAHFLFDGILFTLSIVIR
jgi:membrane protease YdiL (CAAX protease family)